MFNSKSREEFLKQVSDETRHDMIESIRKEMAAAYQQHISMLERRVEELTVYEKIYNKLTITATLKDQT